MKLLICTQAVDMRDPDLGFFHRWIEEFAKHCDKVTVICLRAGRYHLPKNVKVLSLGKENGVPRLRRAVGFLKLIFSHRDDYGAVFVHMNPEYVLLGGFLWRVWGKKISLWYVHKQVNLKLRLAALLVDDIFTASKESFRLKSSKLYVVGHGIDTLQFLPHKAAAHPEIRIITIGRLSASKHVIEMLAALNVLYTYGKKFHFTIVGAPATAADDKYKAALAEEIAYKPFRAHIELVGAVVHEKIPALLAQADVFVNLGTTGSLDKAVLESLAAGVPAVSSNEAFRAILEPYGLFASDMEPERIADTIEAAARIDGLKLRAYVEREHSLSTLVPRLLRALQT